MNHLLRELAPISAEGWEAIEAEAKPRLSTYLAGRQLVDFSGPEGWQHSSKALGRVAAIDGPANGVTAAQRRVLPLVELRCELTVPGPSPATSTGEPPTPTSPTWTARPNASPWPRTWRSSLVTPRPALPASPERRASRRWPWAPMSRATRRFAGRHLG